MTVFDPEVYGEPVYSDVLIAPDVYGEGDIGGWSFTADSVVSATGSGSFTADAYLVQTQSGSFTADAILLGSLSADAVLLKEMAGSVTASTVLLLARSASFTAEAVLLRHMGFSSGSIFLDTFTRSTSAPPFNLGMPDVGGAYAWKNWDSKYGSAASSPTHVNASGWLELDDPGNMPTYDSFTGLPSIDAGDFSFDFWVPAAGDNSQSIRYYENNWYLGIRDNSDLDYLVWGDSGSAYWPVTRNAWHTVRVIVDSTATGAYVKAHLWRRGDTEPAIWTTIQTTWPYHPKDNTSWPDPILDLYYTPNSHALWLDNIRIDTSVPSLSFTLDAFIRTISFTLDAFIRRNDLWFDAVFLSHEEDGRFTANAFMVAAFIGTVSAAIESDATIEASRTGSLPSDAVIIDPTGTRDRTLPADAVIERRTIIGSFSGKAWLSIAVFERVGSFASDAWVVGTIDYFAANAYIIGQTKLRSFGADADIHTTTDRRGTFSVDAWVRVDQRDQFTADASIAQAFFRADARVMPRVYADAALRRAIPGSFLVDACIIPGKTVIANAVLWKTIYAHFAFDAVIANGAFSLDAVIVRPRAYDLPMSALVKRNQTGSFMVDASIPAHFRADAFIRPYFTANAYIRGVDVRVFPPGGGGTGETFPMRDFAILVTLDGADVTGDVLFAESQFTQSARVAPGTFQLALLGAHGYEGGEKLQVSIDGLVTYGGFVTMVERSYVMEDLAQPKTVLSGPDFNILFDKLVVYNKASKPTKAKPGYIPIPAWDKASLDGDIIQFFCANYLDVPGELNYTDYVDNVGTANPGTKGAITSGVSWRIFMQEQSRMTTAVWWIDAYMNLHNHKRSTITAPFAITDGDGGVGARDLRVVRDISRMVTDDLVWGTLATSVEGKTVYSHQTANSTMTADYYGAAIEQDLAYIAALEAVANPTPSQEAALARDLALLAYNQAQQALALANPDANAVGTYGTWQMAEFRSDIHTQTHIRQRAGSILQRYAKPIVTASATVFEPGFQAGQVVSVNSFVHGLSEALVIRQLTLRIILGRGNNRGIPSYSLNMGLDPEDAWDFYDALPFDAGPHPTYELPNPTFWAFGSSGVLDDFQRTVARGHLPSGWGTGDIGEWLEGDSGTVGSLLSPSAQDVEYVDGSVGVIELRRGEMQFDYDYTYAWPVVSAPQLQFDPSSSWVRRPLDVYFDIRVDNLLDAHWYPKGYWYWNATFLLGGSGYANIMRVQLNANADASVINFSATNPYGSGGGGASYYYEDLDLLPSDLFDRWWSVRIEVTDLGIRAKLWHREDAEPAYWSAWEYWSIADTGYWMADPYTIVGWENVNGVGFSEAVLSHDWNHNVYGVSYGPPLPYPGNGEYAIAWDQAAGYLGFSNNDSPSYGLGIVWTVWNQTEHLPACQWSGQGLSSWWDTNRTNAALQPVVSVYVTGQVGISADGHADPNPSGSMTVIGEQFLYDQALPGYGGFGGDAFNPGEPRLLGGSPVFEVTCDYANNTEVQWVPFSFTTTSFTANKQFQWGVFVPGVWDELVGNGPVSGGLCLPAWGGMRVVFRDVYYTPTFAHSIPPVVGGQLSMDNLEIVGGGYGMVAEGWGCESVRVKSGRFTITNAAIPGSVTVTYKGKMLTEHVDWDVVDETWTKFKMLTGKTGLVSACYFSVFSQNRSQPSVTKQQHGSTTTGKVTLNSKDVRGV